MSNIEKKDGNYDILIGNIVNTVNSAKSKIIRNVNSTMLETYWNIGKYIIEYEQNGKIKAEYGLNLLKDISKDLTLKLGRGYSKSNIYNMRRLYEYYPKFQAVPGKLTWSHLGEILTIENELERNFYIVETVKENWGYRELHRQIDSALFLKFASSKNKEDILKLSDKGLDLTNIDDVIKNTYTLDFLGLKDDNYKETELESKIIDNLQAFLLELGKGFAFIKRQYPILIDNVHYYADLVFYHAILKCYIVIDLKAGKVKHGDIGQMNTYLGYFAKDINEENDNPPIGIILSKHKNDVMVEYATYNSDNQLYVSKYELYLPNKEELKDIVDKALSETSDTEVDEMEKNSND